MWEEWEIKKVKVEKENDSVVVYSGIFV